MAAQLVNAATSEKFTEMDWTKSIEICELVAGDQRHAKDVIKAIKKRLEYKGSNTQLYAVTLLEMLMNNIGDHVHKQVIDTGLLSLLVKKVKQSDSPVREKIFLLLDATQTSLGGASAKFPQYYAAYYDLVSAGVQFSQNPRPALSNQSISEAKKNNPVSNGEPVASKHAAVMQQRADPAISESSIIQKAGAALGILREVLDAIDSQHPEEAKDEFTLDLVEQCSFEKQRVMHLVMTSWDEKVVSRAIELNDHLEKVLARHAELLLGKMTSTDNNVSVAEEEVEEEEGAEQLFRRRTKGKACAPPEEDEDRFAKQRFRLLDSTERPHRPLARPLSLDPSEQFRAPQPRVAIPPPPAKHAERERYFNENKAGDGSSVVGLMRGLCLHGRNASSSSDGGRLTL